MGKKHNREKIALDLLLLPTNKEVCGANGISEATLYRIKREDGFSRILQETREKIFGEARDKAQAFSLEAMQVLYSVATDDEATPSSRVSAASKILELGQNVFEQDRIIERLESLEGRITGDEDK